MSGYSYGEAEPTVQCPYCCAVCRADFVDVGVGMVQCGPYHCEVCFASEIGPCDQPRELTAQETETGWYAPGAEPGSSANVVAGKVVDHQTIDGLYRTAFTGNPDYDRPGAVEEWREQTRQGGA